jgi:hypothetical protein
MSSAAAFVGPNCRLGRDEVELITVIPFDACPTSAAFVDGYERALTSFAGLADRAALSGPAATFRDKARAFGDFTRAAFASGSTRGTAALFQDLALAHNAWLPDAAVAVDPPRIVDLYFGVSGVQSTDYFRNLHKDGDKRRADFLASGKHFIWRPGPNGFEGPYLEGEDRLTGGY